MRLRLAGLLVCCVTFAWAQNGEDSQVVQARGELSRIQGLVELGAMPRAKLEQAQDALADAQDGVLLRRLSQQPDLTEAQADELIAAAGRQLDRRKKAFDEGQHLVEAGVAPALSLDTLLRDLDFARRQCDLAETRGRLARELAQQAEAEEALMVKLAQEPAEAPKIGERFDGNGVFTPEIFRQIEAAFEAHFGKPLPVSAMGETAVHRAMGFDHRGRVDVALHPDTPEGQWLLHFLTQNGIPYFAFRQAVPGKATGAHIHLGPISTHLDSGG